MKYTVGAARDIAPGRMVGFDVAGLDVLVANVNGSYYAIGNICTHMGCTLSDGILDGERVQCPCHAATFNVTTGAVAHESNAEPEPTYSVTVENGQIIVEV